MEIEIKYPNGAKKYAEMLLNGISSNDDLMVSIALTKLYELGYKVVNDEKTSENSHANA